MFLTASQILESAVRQQAFPAAVIEVGDATRPLWRRAFGRLRYDAGAPAAAEDTIFDLASLTKVLATAAFVMQQVERGSLGLDDCVGEYISAWEGADRAHVTVRDLLSHAGGLTAYVPFYRDHSGRAEFERAICSVPLEYEPRTKSVYSDLGFMLLGFILEDQPSLAPRASARQAEISLPARFDALRRQIGLVEDMQFHLPALWKARTAPTEIDPWRDRLLVGEVHDENAAALGGAAGHAGLFGTAMAVGQYARHLLQILDGKVGAFQRDTLEMFIARRSDIPGSSRALGWDTMLPASSCGGGMSPRAFGHTGFTGTSLWVDPDRGVYVVLLTNRVHPRRANDAIKQIRPAVHDAVMHELDAPRS
jgi:CubicO group peptidase (beta-lactamase class C family)